MSRILVTGVEGFAGGHLARQLSQSGHEVIGLHWADPPGPLPAQLHRIDVCDFDPLKSLLDSARPDRVFHLAGISSVAVSERQVAATWSVNTGGTLNLLESVRQLGLACRVLLISSADVYGRSESGRPLTEESPLRPLSPYALSKLAVEELGRFFCRAYGLDVVIIRPFSHTGPGQAPNFVFPSVARRIVEIESGAEPFIDVGNVQVRRDYTDVRDVCRAYALALERCPSGETYNVTSGRPVTIGEGIEFLCGLSRRPVTIRRPAERRRDRDLPLLTGDPAKFVAATGWRPEIPFTQTLTDLLEYCRSRS